MLLSYSVFHVGETPTCNSTLTKGQLCYCCS
uniref:Uncharacterized protein n=1 Tax=Rhizophora mucronata TaxID=61149 RepID=A0A2P2Q4R2_RHIMU